MSYTGRSAGTHVRAFFAAALASAVAAATVLLGWGIIDGAGIDPGFYFISLVVALLICIVAGILIGLPVSWLLIRARHESGSIYALSGLLAGALLSLSFFVRPSSAQTMAAQYFVMVLALGAIPGAVSGAVWWLLIRRHASRGADPAE